MIGWLYRFTVRRVPMRFAYLCAIRAVRQAAQDRAPGHPMPAAFHETLQALTHAAGPAADKF